MTQNFRFKEKFERQTADYPQVVKAVFTYKVNQAGDDEYFAAIVQTTPESDTVSITEFCFIDDVLTTGVLPNECMQTASATISKETAALLKQL